MCKAKIITRNLSFFKFKTFYSNLVKKPPPTPPYNHIVQIGDPTLRLKSEPVPVNAITSPETCQIISKLKQVFHKYQCLGLAAPQIGVARRIFIFGLDSKTLSGFTDKEIADLEIKTHDLTVVINPVVKITDNRKYVYPENCESVKGYYGNVARNYALELTGFNEKGGEIKMSAKGWLSRIIQHEMDHLDGSLYTDIMDRKSFTCGCWEVVNRHRGYVNLHYHSA